jgi:predicted DNA-binding protein with PD1-like motif
MKSRLVWEQAGERTFVVVLESGDEAFATITDFANRNGLGGASLTEQCEGLTLLGDIAIGDDGKASLHMHAVLGLQDGSTRGGHFLNGIVRPTLEVTIVETPAHLRRRTQPGLGIALIQP